MQKLSSFGQGKKFRPKKSLTSLLHAALQFIQHLFKGSTYSSKSREDELRERIPVPHDDYLKFIITSHPCCKGYFYLLIA